jgi:alkylation response protein AidB-like acyl-CoA dehydrogenase
MVIPKSQIEPIYDWNVNGLRGTGSNSFKADNLFVPEERTFKDTDGGKVAETFNGINRSLLFASGFAFVALGIARASLDETFKIASKKRPQGKSLLRDQELIQNQIGQAEAIWRSSKALLVTSISDLIESAKTEGEPAIDDRIAVRLASTHAIRGSAQIVDTTYNICGSHAVYNSNPIHTRFQDIHAITQQVQGRLEHYSTAGQHLMGIKTESPFF